MGDTLSILRADLEELVAMVNAGGPGSVRKVLELVSAGNLVEIDPRFAAFLGGVGSSTDVVVSDSILNALENFARCNVHEVENYARYAAEQSPYITHQGVKGAEFARVLVVLDDEEGRHNQFSYDKFFGIRDPSATDRENERSGKESVFDRTRRLLYVCVSRSTEALALVIYSHDVSRAAEALRASGLPGASAVLTSKDLWEG